MMAKILIPFALAAAAGAAAMSTANAAGERKPGPYAREQMQIEKELSRLKPQASVDCIDTRFRNVSLRAVGNKLVYRESRNRIFVSETAGGCENVARGDALVTRQFGPRLCRGDIATTLDRAARFETGSCAIGPFTPYTAG